MMTAVYQRATIGGKISDAKKKRGRNRGFLEGGRHPRGQRTWRRKKKNKEGKSEMSSKVGGHVMSRAGGGMGKKKGLSGGENVCSAGSLGGGVKIRKKETNKSWSKSFVASLLTTAGGGVFVIGVTRCGGVLTLPGKEARRDIQV